MKLVDILVKNLDKWPETRYEYKCTITQDADSHLCIWGLYSPFFADGEWETECGNGLLDYREVNNRAEDYDTAIVTKQMWLDAKAAKELSIDKLDPNSTEYKIAVMQHYLNGGEVEVKGKFEGNDGWVIWAMSYEPQWSWHDSDFRIKLEPVEPAYFLPEIPWDVIEDKYKWFAFDGDEYDDQYHGYLYTTKPEAILDETGGYWEDDQGDLARVEGLKFNKGNAPWDKSLVKRPE